jgi:alkylation response protein AidB-like acyl-CoA dehydrogenase
MAGGAERALEITAEYAKHRVQFGVPIGSFQAVQHRCADMLTDVDTSRLMTYYAAWKLSEGMPAALEVSMAKAWLSNAYKRVVRSGHQVHGGAGYIQEHPMQYFFRNAKASEAYLGDAVFHRRTIQRCLGY